MREMLAWVGLADRASARPATLSGGEQQRVAIARAVISRPELLVADEPTGNVDAEMASRLLHLFSAMNQLGTTVLVATHDVSLIRTTPGAELIRLESGTMADPTGALRNPPGGETIMIRALFAPPADRRLLGLKPLSGPTPWLVAIMSFSILVIAAAGLAIANSAGLFARSVEARYSIEVPSGSVRSPALLAALRSDDDVTNVSAVSEQAMRADLRRWLGSFADNKDLPVPALLNFDLKPGAELAGVRARVLKAEPLASIEAHETAVGPILSSLRTLQWVALALVVLLAGRGGSGDRAGRARGARHAPGDDRNPSRNRGDRRSDH